MIIIDKKSTMKLMYYLSAIDGEISREELEKIDEIAAHIDDKNFNSYKHDFLEECRNLLEKENWDELILKAIPMELVNEVSTVDEGVPSRLIIWNLLLLVYAKGYYENEEKNLIALISDTLKIERSVFLELEQAIDAYSSVCLELVELEQSEGNTELIIEYKNRRDIISKSVTELLADELVSPVDKVIIKDDFIDKGKIALKKKVKPLGECVGFGMYKIKDGTKSSLEKAGKSLAKLFGKKGK